MSWKRWLRTALESPAGALALGALESVVPPGRHRLYVLTYHHCPPDFEQHVRYVTGRFSPIDAGTLVAALRGEAELPPRALLVTFDDAYEDFATQAWPVLVRHGVPAVLFVPTAFPAARGAGFWWDRVEAAVLAARVPVVETPLGALPLRSDTERLRALLQLRQHCKLLPSDQVEPFVDALHERLDGPPVDSKVLGWDELRRLAREGVEIASHTRTHPMLDRCPPALVRAELRDSVADLRRELGAESPLFAYPAGQFNDLVVRLVREAGFVGAFTTERGTNRIGKTDPHRLRRINVSVTSSTVLRTRALQSTLHLDVLEGVSPREAARLMRSRVLFKGLDAVLTAPVRAAGNGRPRPSRYETTRRAARSLIGTESRRAERVRRWLLCVERLPLRCRTIELAAYGAAATVFRVETDTGTWALKVYRDSIGLGARAMREVALRMEDQDDRAREVLGEDLVARTQQLLLESPLLGTCAAGGLQRFVDAPLVDVFDDVEEDRVVALGRRHPGLRAQLLRVADATLADVERGGTCLDLVGHQNLLLVTHGEEPCLRLIDSGFFELARLAAPVRSRLDARCAWLARVRAALRAALPERASENDRHSY